MVCLILALGVTTQLSQAQTTPLNLHFTPDSLALTPQTTGHLSLNLTANSQLYAFDIAITYDSTVVTVVDTDPNTQGTQVAVGSLLAGKKIFIAENEADNGIIRLAGTFISPEPALTAEGSLFDITWQAQNKGQTDLLVSRAILITQDNTRLEVITSTGYVQIGLPMTLTGQAQRQGRTDHAGINVTSAQQTVQTTAQGQFSLSGFNPYRLHVSATHYLSAWLEGETSNGQVSSITLLGGDVTGNNQIDIFDLAFIGSRYQSQDNQADLTGDGQVNIFDLALAAGNYGQIGQ